MDSSMKYILWLFSIFLAIGLTKTANILILLPLPLYSHTNTFLPIFKELASRGHNITMVSPYPQKQVLPNWTDITIDNSIFKLFMGIILFLFNSYIHFLCLNFIYLVFWVMFIPGEYTWWYMKKINGFICLSRIR